MFLLDMREPFIDIDEQSKELLFGAGMTNSMITKFGAQPGDVIQSINEQTYNLDNINALIMSSMSWKAGDELNLVVMREGTPTTLTAVYETPVVTKEMIVPMELSEDDARMKLRQVWLFGE